MEDSSLSRGLGGGASIEVHPKRLKVLRTRLGLPLHAGAEKVKASEEKLATWRLLDRIESLGAAERSVVSQIGAALSDDPEEVAANFRRLLGSPECWTRQIPTPFSGTGRGR
jgi:hypothetical protein